MQTRSKTSNPSCDGAEVPSGDLGLNEPENQQTPSHSSFDQDPSPSSGENQSLEDLVKLMLQTQIKQQELLDSLIAGNKANKQPGKSSAGDSPRTLVSDGSSRDVAQDSVPLLNEEPSGFFTPELRYSHVTPPQNYSVDACASSSSTIPINQVNPPNFDGDKSSARSWLRTYDDVMQINGYSDHQKLQRARAYLTGEGLQWFNTTMRLMKQPTWETLKSSFLKHFCGTDGIAALRKKLAETRQRSNEHPSSFFVRVVDLCLEYNPKMSDQELVDRVAQGLLVNTYNSLATQANRETWTIDWIREKFEQLKACPETPQREANNDAKWRKSSTAAPTKVRDLSTWTCFNCNEKGHIIENCKKPRDESAIKARTEEFRASKAAKAKQNGDESQEQRNLNHVANTQLKQSDSPDPTSLPCDSIPKPQLTILINGHPVIGRVDTGADMTVLPDEVAVDLNLPLLPWDQPALQALGTTPITPVGMTSISADYGNSRRAILVAVLPKGTVRQPLWGNDLLVAFSIKLCQVLNNDGSQPSISNIESTTHPIDKVEFGELIPCDRQKFEQLLLDSADVFSRDEFDIGRTSSIKHRIFLTDDKPVCRPPYRTAIRLREPMEESIKKLLTTGAIRPSKSPFSSPVFFVDKDRGASLRLVADFRALNSKTVPDRTPMPHPEDVFGMLAGTKVFAKLDITSMFNQIEVDERDIEKTAITTPFGLYECPLMPFGLVNAPATAVRLMKEVLRDLDSKICFVYFDDIIIFATDCHQLIDRCKSVLARLRLHGLKLKPSKCVFAVQSVKFLGHIVTSKGIVMDPRRIEDVMKFPVPRNPSDVRSFHGLCSYNRKFIRDFATIAKPLTPLMGKPADFVWNIEAQTAFETLKKSLTKAPVLVHFDPDAQHELRTDASSYAIGAVLYQKHDNPDNTGVVLYYSKSLTSAQKSYSATERELLAAFSAITDMKHYLIGKRFTLVTDHAALTLLKNHKDPHKRLARWVAQLQCYDFDVVYKSGALHKDADCMSRLTPYQQPDDDETSKQEERLIRAISHISNAEEATQQFESVLSYDMRLEQRNDEFCRKYIQILEDESISDSEKARRAKNFSILDGQLYRTLDGESPTIVIPTQRRAAILLSAHDTPIGGHLGFTRTYSLIRSRFYWPKMRRDTKRHVSTCLNCQRRKARNTRRQGLIRNLPIAMEVFDTVAIDLMTKLPTTHTGYKALLVCTDNLSKYVVAVPLRNELAETILHAFFNHVVAVHGCPRVVISDNGSNICGERSRDFYRLFGIRRILTSPYHPQSNGQTERFNRTLAASLTIFVETNQKDWSDYIQALTFAYNVSEHSVTRVSPYEIVFNRRPRLPIDNVMERSEFIDPTRPAPGVLSSEAVNNMKKLILKNQLANKRRLDERLARTTFKEGDLVLVERPTRVGGVATKLTYTYIGPYRIHRKLNDLSFEIKCLRGRSGVSVVHPYHLKKFIAREGEVADALVDPKFIPREELTLLDDEIPTTEEDASIEQVPSHDTNHELNDIEDDIPSPPFEPLTPPQVANQ